MDPRISVHETTRSSLTAVVVLLMLAFASPAIAQGSDLLGFARDAAAAGNHGQVVALLDGWRTQKQASAADHRDGLFLLAEAFTALERHEDAAKTFEATLEATKARGARSAIEDTIRLGLAKSYMALSRWSDARSQLRRAAAGTRTAHREEAILLRSITYEKEGQLGHARAAVESLISRYPDAPDRREWIVRLGQLQLASNHRRQATDTFLDVYKMAPQSRAGWAARVELEKLGKLPPPSESGIEHLSTLADWVEDRRFAQSRAPLELRLLRAQELGLKSEVLRCKKLLLRVYWGVREWRLALETNRWLDKHVSSIPPKEGVEVDDPTLSSWKVAQAYGYLGEWKKATRVMLKKHSYHRGRQYHTTMGDLSYYFGRYEEAFEHYEAVQKKRGRKSLTDRMVWCLLRMGERDKSAAKRAAERWRDAGESRRSSRLFKRYWFARAMQLADDIDKARTVYQHLVEDAPRDYYGIQAWSRLQELDKIAPTAVETGTIAWSAASQRGAFDAYPRRADHATIERTTESLATEYGSLLPELARAHQLVRIGKYDAAETELRIVDMDLRALRGGNTKLLRRGRSDLLDNRRSPKARGGESYRQTRRYDGKQVRAVARVKKALRKALREAQVALADPYGMRRQIFESGGLKEGPETTPERWRQAYPIAWPEAVSTFSKQFAVSPYFIYGVMTVESAFASHPVSVSDAYGVLQVIPKTGRRLSSELGYTEHTPELLLNPEVAIYYGTYYLSSLVKKFNGQELLAAAAYNAGPHRVGAWLDARGKGSMDMFIEEIPYDQARGYAKSVLANIAKFRATYHGESNIYVTNALKRDYSEQPNY